MIGLDTNVLARYVMQDDPRQSPRATRLIESLSAEAPGFVPVVTLVELVWVLSGSYGLNRAQVATVIETLLRSRELLIDRAELVAQALARFGTAGADFADALIERIATAAGCGETMTFDSGAARVAGMTLVP
ncbi:MAG: type II toxin-antitoxin system VapC family toxin [Rubrivivax sp.]|nr:type II toxin-antitoxin system VapC family toxin [Rubrivivax sp.]